MDESQKLQEDPDRIYFTDKKGDIIGDLYYTDYDNVVCVACFGDIRIGNSKTSKRGWVAGVPISNEIFYNGQQIPNAKYDGETHDELINSIYNADEDFDYGRGIHMRLFYLRGKYYAVFWETDGECKRWKKEIIQCLEFFTKGKLNKVMMQFEYMDDNAFVPIRNVFDFNEKVKRTKSKAAAELAKQLHLMGPKEKAEFLKKMGAMQPNKIQAAAAKLGMTAIELRQALGMDIAENSLGNLSFSDYNDPSIPYEAKPRTSIGFSYGTVFERFTRRRKRFC
jgi:hypothetical protein